MSAATPSKFEIVCSALCLSNESSADVCLGWALWWASAGLFHCLLPNVSECLFSKSVWWGWIPSMSAKVLNNALCFCVCRRIPTCLVLANAPLLALSFFGWPKSASVLTNVSPLPVSACRVQPGLCSLMHHVCHCLLGEFQVCFSWIYQFFFWTSESQFLIKTVQVHLTCNKELG